MRRCQNRAAYVEIGGHQSAEDGIQIVEKQIVGPAVHQPKEGSADHHLKATEKFRKCHGKRAKDLGDPEDSRSDHASLPERAAYVEIDGHESVEGGDPDHRESDR